MTKPNPTPPWKLHPFNYVFAICEVCDYWRSSALERTPTGQAVARSARRHARWNGHQLTLYFWTRLTPKELKPYGKARIIDETTF